jgi:hypothetical protein
VGGAKRNWPRRPNTTGPISPVWSAANGIPRSECLPTSPKHWTFPSASCSQTSCLPFSFDIERVFEASLACPQGASSPDRCILEAMKRFLGLAGVGVLVLAATTLVVTFWNRPGFSQPVAPPSNASRPALIPPRAAPAITTSPIRWNPAQLVVTLSPGGTNQVEVTATVKTNVSNVTASVGDSLAPFAHVTPPSLSSVTSGAVETFRLSFAIPSDRRFKTIDGVLQLRQGKNAIGAPLPIRLNIWPSLSVPDSALVLAYPPLLTPIPFSSISGTQVTEFTRSDGAGFDLEVVETKSTAPTVVEWAGEQTWPFPDSWTNHFSIVSVAGLAALKDPTTGSVTLKRNDKVYFVNNGLGREDSTLLDDATFKAILGSLVFTP